MKNTTETTIPSFPALTEWLNKLKPANILEFLQEDNTKYKRLKQLGSIIGIEHNTPETLNITDVTSRTENFEIVFNQKKGKYYHWRVIPKTPNYPKYRVRAVLFEDGYEWFKKLEINPDNYSHIEIIKYNKETVYSTIFLINDFGIWGEIIKGDLWQLASGEHIMEPSLYAYYNFHNWKFSKPSGKEKAILKKAIKKLKITTPNIQEQLRSSLNAEFTRTGYLKGYFEFVVWPKNEILFMDYNREIYKLLRDFNFKIPNQTSELSGLCANSGLAIGKAKKIINPHTQEFSNDEILICELTTIDFLPLMKKARAIITQKGNLLSHASIIARELNKPCIVAAKEIMNKINDGDIIFIDASRGIIKKIS